MRILYFELEMAYISARIKDREYSHFWVRVNSSIQLCGYIQVRNR